MEFCRVCSLSLPLGLDCPPFVGKSLKMELPDQGVLLKVIHLAPRPSSLAPRHLWVFASTSLIQIKAEKVSYRFSRTT